MNRKSVLIALILIVAALFSISSAMAYTGSFSPYKGSVSMTVRPSKATANMAAREQVLSAGGQGNWGVYMGNPANSITFFTFSNTVKWWEDIRATGLGWLANTSHSVIITWDTSSGKKIYVDGSLKAYYSGSYSQRDPGQGIFVGYWLLEYESSEHMFPFSGDISNVTFYTYVLSASEVVDIAGGGTGGGEPPPTNTGTITGVIIDGGTGEGVGGATVATSTGGYSDVSESPLPGFSNKQKGEFTITGVPAGTYTLNITKTGYTTKQVTGVTVSNSKTKDLGNISIYAPGVSDPDPGDGDPDPDPEPSTPTITGKILDGGSSTGLRGVRIEVSGATKGYTDDSGNFSVTLDSTGSYRLFFEKDGYHELASAIITLTTASPTANAGNLNMYSPEQEAYLYFASSEVSYLASSWWSDVILLNPNNSNLMCTVSVFGDDEGLSFTETIASQGKKKLTGLYAYFKQKSGNLWNKERGWMKIRTSGGYEIVAKQLMGSSRMKFLSSMTSERLARRHVVPLYSPDSSWWIGTSLLNPGNETCSIDIKIMSSSSGQYYAVDTKEVTLQPSQVLTDSLENIIGSLSGTADDSWLEITADFPIAVFFISGNSNQAVGGP